MYEGEEKCLIPVVVLRVWKVASSIPTADELIPVS